MDKNDDIITPKMEDIKVKKIYYIKRLTNKGNRCLNKTKKMEMKYKEQ